jgi:hypothetical protein
LGHTGAHEAKEVLDSLGAIGSGEGAEACEVAGAIDEGPQAIAHSPRGRGGQGEPSPRGSPRRRGRRGTEYLGRAVVPEQRLGVVGVPQGHPNVLEAQFDPSGRGEGLPTFLERLVRLVVDRAVQTGAALVEVEGPGRRPITPRAVPELDARAGDTLATEGDGTSLRELDDGGKELGSIDGEIDGSVEPCHAVGLGAEDEQQLVEEAVFTEGAKYSTGGRHAEDATKSAEIETPGPDTVGGHDVLRRGQGGGPGSVA